MTSDNEHGWILPGSLYSVAVGGVCLGAACATPGPIFVVAATAGLGHAIGATGLGLGGVGLQKLCSRPVAREMQQTRQNSDPWTSPIQSHRLPTRSAPVWEFQETETCWVRFRDDQQKILEDAYCRNCSKLCFSKDEQKGHRWARTISFADMTQTNEVTGKVRRIRRREEEAIDAEAAQLKFEAARLEIEAARLKIERCDSDLSSLSRRLLSNLPTLDSTSKLERQEIDRSQPEFSELVKIFQDSMAKHRKERNSAEWCPKPMVEVVLIEEVVNPDKQGLYVAARKEVGSRNPSGCGPVPGIKATKLDRELGKPDLNEYFLFHGTKYDQVDKIIEQGLDPQRGGDSVGKMFGCGTYFAENVSKSDMYTTCDQCVRGKRTDGKCTHATGTRCMLVAQVLLGETFAVKRRDEARTRAEDRQDGSGPHDSHTALKTVDGGCVDHMEFIIFKEQHALLRFAIFYKHKNQCKCKDCYWRRAQRWG